MKRLERLEEMKEQKARYAGSGINQTFGQAYFSARENDNELLDFGGALWENELDEIAENLRTFEIKDFTISSTYSGIAEILAAFEARGFKMTGLTEVNASYNDFMTNKPKRIHAFRMQEI